MRWWQIGKHSILAAYRDGDQRLLADQELTLSYAYWEGAVRVEGEWADQAVRGNGYVEMTGYAGSMQGQF